MRRREFIAMVGAAVAWPKVACAQRAERIRRIGVLMDISQDNRARSRLAAFNQGLKDLGWIEGRDIKIPCIGPQTHQKQAVGPLLTY